MLAKLPPRRPSHELGVRDGGRERRERGVERASKREEERGGRGVERGSEGPWSATRIWLDMYDRNVFMGAAVGLEWSRSGRARGS